MRPITWAQELKLKANNWFTRLLTAGVPAWKCPPPDRFTVHRDRTRAGSSSPVPWTPKYDLPVEVGPSTLSTYEGVRLTGMPVEVTPAGAPLRDVVVYSPERGKPRVERVPVPADAWIEGHPMQTGAFDRHWLGVAPDGTSWEFIQMSYAFGFWRAQEGGQWGPDGKLLKGYSCTAGGVQLAAQILTRDVLENPCVIGAVVPNYSNADGTDPDAPIACGDWLRLPHPPDPAVHAGDAFRLLSLLHTHGVRIFDRMGMGDQTMKLVTQAGDNWAGSNLGSVKLRTTDFHRVTEASS